MNVSTSLSADVRVLVAVHGWAEQREHLARCVSDLVPEALVEQLADQDQFSFDESGGRYTHVLLGSGYLAAQDHQSRDLVEWLRSANVSVAVLEDQVRGPSTLENDWNPPGQVFVLTPDRLLRRPGAIWCPYVAQTSSEANVTAWPRHRRPVLLHLSPESEKKRDEMLRIFADLDEAGLISYKRADPTSREDLAGWLVGADMVFDDASDGSYGVAGCDAMAAGKIVLGSVDDEVRLVVREQTGLSLPIVNVTPANAAEVVTNLVSDVDEARRVASLGRSFAADVHDGRLTSASLRQFFVPQLVEEPRKPATRGRLVMLVDNNVVPDSRVQKQARSAAARGWEVVLLGHQRPGTKKTWKIGKARVRLITVGAALNKRHHVRRSARLRSPLAYGRLVMAQYQQQLVRARTDELRMDRALFKAGEPDQAMWRAMHLFTRRARLAVQRRWVGFRVGKTEQLSSRRVEMSSPLDRFTTQFWKSIGGNRAWRWLDPSLWEWEIAYGSEIDQLKPDIIHANDFRMLGVGARAKLRAVAAGRSTKLVWDAHEFLPGIKPWSAHPRWHIAQMAYEREYAPHADAVVTVSSALADLLMREHGLRELPTVVLNAPEVASVAKPMKRIRLKCGLGDEVPLLVYSGLAAPQRGLDTMVEALAFLPDVHVAFVVSSPKAPYVLSLLDLAAGLHVSDRVHILPYVPVSQIVDFLSTADIGVIPILHYPNHEIALITKFLEYSHARLPIVVSDVKTMSAMVRETGQGEVFSAEDVASFASAVQRVLSDRATYRAAYDRPGLLEGWTWETAADALDQVYVNVSREK